MIGFGRSKAKNNKNNAYEPMDIALSAVQYIPFIKQLHLSAQIIVQNLTSGTYQQRRAGDGSRFWQHHPYQSGDPIKQIDWKASAKHGAPMILQKEAEQTQSILLHCPHHNGMDYAPQQSWIDQLGQLKAFTIESGNAKKNEMFNSKFSAALLLSACLMDIFKKQRHPFATTASQHGTKMGLSDDFIQAQLAQLCSHANTAPPLNKNSHRKHIIWIDDFWGDLKDIERQIINIRNQNSVPYLLQVVTNDELTLPFKGHLRFENSDIDDDTQLADIPMVEAIRNDYQARIKAHLEQLRQLCNKQNVFYQCLILGANHNDNDMLNRNFLKGHGQSDLTRFLEDMMHAVSTVQDGIMA